MSHPIRPDLMIATVTDVLQELSRQARVLVYGGRGIGKSHVLRTLASRSRCGLSAAQSDRVRFVEGRKPEAEKEVLDWLTRTKRSNGDLLLVDDFQWALTPEVDEHLLSIQPDDRRSHQLVVTTRLPPTDLEQQLQARKKEKAGGGGEWTYTSLDSFVNIRLDPWRYGWEATVRSAVAGALRELEGVLGTPASGTTTGEEGVPGDWIRLVNEITGGHPLLVGEAFVVLARLLYPRLAARDERLLAPADPPFPVPAGAERLLEPVAGNDRRLDGLRRLIEDRLVENAMPRLWRSLRWLSSRAPAAFAALADLAGELHPEAGGSGTYRQQLYSLGLAYLDPKSGAVVVPGALLRDAIRATAGVPPTPAAETAEPGGRPTTVAAAPSVAAAQVELIPHAQEPARGEVRVTAAGATTTIAFSGRYWRLLSILFDRKPAPVPVAELAQEVGEKDNERALRGVLDRLRTNLERRGLHDLLINVWGEGYQWGQSPTWHSR